MALKRGQIVDFRFSDEFADEETYPAIVLSAGEGLAAVLRVMSFRIEANRKTLAGQTIPSGHPVVDDYIVMTDKDGVAAEGSIVEEAAAVLASENE